jgi:branched-chain amino acid transport system ATP-binding protein
VTAAPPILAGDSITVSLGGRPILQAAYVDAVPGRITALVGRSGAGKTTMFKVLVGSRHPTGGQVRWQGERVARPSLPALARRGLFYHPDRPWLALQLTFAQHGALLGRGRDWRGAAAALGVTPWIDQRVGSLSGGELRLTELAFGLALEPKVALLDEPFRGLEPLHRERVAAALRVLAERGAAVLYADHDVEAVRRTADRLFSIEAGVSRLVEGFRDRPLREWYHEWPR